MNPSLKVAIVEDNEWFNKFLCHIVSLIQEYEVRSYFSGNDFLKDLDNFKPDIVSLDYRLPDMTGKELMKKVKSLDPSMDILIVSEQEDVQTAIELMKSGASEYLVKTREMKVNLLNSLRHISENRQLKSEIRGLRSEVVKRHDFSRSIIGNSSALQRSLKLVEKALSSNISVVINGETGTGKEVLAKAIHYGSSRKEGRFVAVNVAAIPSELIESELFGFEKGAFTHATNKRIGKFEEADGGTLFLDEIGEMPLGVQAKLLRVLQEKEVARLGSNVEIKIDCRIIAATHRDLFEEVKKGNFREDLYYRLFGLNVILPPLRERDQDVILLAEYFSKTFAEENGLETKRLSASSREKLLDYSWPGNIRELKSVIDLACILTDSDTIEPEHLSLRSSIDTKDLLGTNKTLREYSIEIVKHFLEKHDNDISKVSRLLDVGRTTIYRMLKESE
ncbi:sigma-54 dependent transcriptional regulator [Wandonia haliotis]|uniref:Sigma-54 dependent transcriptional regulator n=1 Tax=Wandonia haliotis TaxID=574963 RepID=A0ABN1MTL1_9FLAO